MFLNLVNLNKSFNKDKVVDHLNLSLDHQQTLSILGRSGCGKTTMLKIVAGLITADAGEILLGGKNISKLKPRDRQTVYLYQEDLLFPHLNVFENIAFGLRLKKQREAEIQIKVEEMISSLELEGQALKMPQQLSGGQRQRVSFGRAIITNPSLLLLDEPFGSLDAGTRARMQQLFKKLSAQFKITSLFVTHDLKEAILMGDKIGLMQAGKLKIYSSRQDFIEDPETGVQAEVGFWDQLNESKNTTV